MACARTQRAAAFVTRTYDSWSLSPHRTGVHIPSVATQHRAEAVTAVATAADNPSRLHCPTSLSTDRTGVRTTHGVSLLVKNTSLRASTTCPRHSRSFNNRQPLPPSRAPDPRPAPCQVPQLRHHGRLAEPIGIPNLTPSLHSCRARATGADRASCGRRQLAHRLGGGAPSPTCRGRRRRAGGSSFASSWRFRFLPPPLPPPTTPSGRWAHSSMRPVWTAASSTNRRRRG